MHRSTVQRLLSALEGYLAYTLISKLACRYLDGISLSDYYKWRRRQGVYYAAEGRMVAAATALIQVRIEDRRSCIQYDRLSQKVLACMLQHAVGQVKGEGAPVCPMLGLSEVVLRDCQACQIIYFMNAPYKFFSS